MRPLTLVVCLLLGWAHGVGAEPVIVHPDFDFAPSVSADGRQLVFVSNRSGNRDLWIQDLSAGPAAVPRPLTDHPAADTEPSLDPSGRWLLHVSHATDPRGDIHLSDLEKGTGQTLTDRAFGENSPVWSPDGSAFLYTRQASGDHPMAVMRRELGKQEATLWVEGVSSCAQGPQTWLICSKEGRLVALSATAPTEIKPLTAGPEWDREPRFVPPDRLFFTRFSPEDDTRSGLWMARFQPGKGLSEWYRLTPEGLAPRHPSVAGEWVYFGDARDGEIHRLNRATFLELYQDPFQARAAAARHFAAGEREQGLLILENLSANPERIPVGERLAFDLEYLDFLQEAGWHAKARAVIARHAGAGGVEGGVVAIHALALPIHEAATRTGPQEVRVQVDRAVEAILSIGKRWPGEERLQSVARIEASRLRLLTGETLAALDHLSVLDDSQDQSVRVRALFARGRVYRLLKDESGLKKLFLEVVRAVGEAHRWGVLALSQAIAVTGQGRTFPEQITALRELMNDNPDLKRLAVMTLMRIAQLYQENGEEEKTVATLDEIGQVDAVPGAERIRSLKWKAERLIRLEAFDRAAAAYGELSQVPDLPEGERQVVEALMTRQKVRAATRLRELGDGKAAAKLLGRILADHPDSVDAHREYIATKVQLGALKEMVSHYEKWLGERPNDPLRLYAQALTLSYLDPPDYPRLIALLERVVAQSPRVAFYHQTLAWLHEGFEVTGKGGRGHLEQAAKGYQAALRLTDAPTAPQEEANLLLNLGNVFFAMNNHGEAYRYFQRWTQRKRPLSDPLAHALLHRKLAESAFKTDRTAEAIVLYRKALDVLPEDQPVLRIEVQERLALAFQAMGEHASAATWFSKAMEGNLALNKTENLALLQRNIAVNLHQAARPATTTTTPTAGVATPTATTATNTAAPVSSVSSVPAALTAPLVDRGALREALASYLKSLELLAEHGKRDRPAGKGFFSLVFSLGENGSQAALGFDRSGEEKLLFSFVSTVYDALEEPEAALEFLQKKWALLPESVDPDAGQQTERAVLANRIGVLQYRLGQRAQAMEQTLASLELTESLKVNFGNRVNWYNLSKIAVEMLAAGEPVDPEWIGRLADRVQTAGWERSDPRSGFYTLANAAFLLVQLPETLEPGRGGGEERRWSAWHRRLELKSLADSFYRRAEALLTTGSSFTSRELWTNLIRIKLNRLVIATAAEKTGEAARLKQEITQWAALGLSETGWILEWLDAEEVRDPVERGKRLQAATRSALALPAPLQAPGAGRSQNLFLEPLVRSQVEHFLERREVAAAFAVSERLDRHRLALLLQDRLGREFFLNGLGEAREEISVLLSDLELALGARSAERIAAADQALHQALEGVRASRPLAVSWLSPAEPMALAASALRGNRPYLKWVAGRAGGHLFLVTGEEVLHATVSSGGEWTGGDRRLPERLAQAELVHLSAPEGVDARGVLAGWLPAGRPLVHLHTLYDLLTDSPRQGLFHSRVAVTGEAGDTLTGIAAGMPIQALPLAVGLGQDPVAQLATAHVLLARLPVSGLALPVGSRDRVTEKVALEKLDLSEGHTALLVTGAGVAGSGEQTMLDAAFRHGGFAHVIQVDAGEPWPVVERVWRGYLSRLGGRASALFALEEAWKETGEKRPNPFRFSGIVGLDAEQAKERAVGLYEEEVAEAVSLQQSGELAGAVRRVENALALMKRAGRMDHFARLTGFAVETLFKLEEYQRAVIHQERLVAEWGTGGQDPAGLAQAHYTLGVLWSRLERYEPAIAQLEAAIRMWQQTGGDGGKLAEGVATLGIVQENRGDHEQALNRFGHAFELSRQHGDKRAMAEQHLRMGRIHHVRLSRHAKAREHFEQALALFQETDDPEGQTRALLDIGLTEEALGNFVQAEAHYRQGRERAEALDAPLLMATAALRLANTAWFQGEYQAAFQGLNEADGLAKRAKDIPLAIMIANTRGLVYWTLNEHDKALLHLDKAVELAEREKIPSELASSLNNKGLILRETGRLDEALQRFRQALQIDEGLKSRWGLGYDHRNIGLVLMRQGKLKEAEAGFVLAESISREIGDVVNQAKALLALGQVKRALEQWSESARFFGQARELATRHVIREVQWRAMAAEAGLLARQGRGEEAIRAYDAAIQVVERMRASLKIDALRNSFQEDKQELYRDIIVLLVDQGREREAFDYLERFRARNFIDLLANQKIDLRRKEDETALRRVNGLFQELETLARELAAKSGSDPASQERYRKKQAEAEEAQLELQQRNPELSGFVSVHPITLDRFEKLLEPGVGVLAYLLTGKEIFIWMTRSTGTVFKRVAADGQTVNETIRRYRDGMQNLEPVERVMTRLHEWLIQPMAESLRDVRYLGIIPHESLHFLAFAALRGADGGVLVERYPLFYSPSASAMEYAFGKRSRPSGKKRVLAVGNPDLGDLNFDLPLAEFEADSIRWSFPDGESLKGKKATKRWILDHISQYGIIHIAAHGEFQNINPLFSSLWLAAGEGEKDKAGKAGDPESGRLTVKEIFSLDIKADLVTLSACQTGLGQLRGSEMIGLNRAFLYAGTQSLISSLWRVDDLSTSVLMKHFYRNYTHMNKADSLRQAQLMVKQNFPHPANWAGFNLLGDYR
ncbi:MAG: CHAT domain-containing protein [Magnetococcales bacterium]|nr:CHAT domain-containing protein [Magnetococcales bacterium]